MLIRTGRRLTEHHVTPYAMFCNRRRLLVAAGAAGAALGADLMVPGAQEAVAAPGCAMPLAEAARLAAGEVPSPLADISGYNNYFEFSTDKKAVRTLAQALTTTPWPVSIEGEVERPYVIDAGEMNRLFGNEERIYRLRCVEGWSMVVPWSGFPLCRLIERARPTSKARFVEFVSLKRSAEMIGQRNFGALEWPYREGLRIDEAMHPLTFVVTGLYGEALPKQNGAPLRLAVPWKYGFKSAKAIIQVRLVNEQPKTSWVKRARTEYGFFGNVNPDIPHPRWSQAREIRVGELRKQPTLYLNGYADQVASLYAGMDPATLF